MKLLYTADIHVNRKHLVALLEAAEREGVGAVIIGGDIVPKELFGKLGKVVRNQRNYLQDEFLPDLRKFRSGHPGVKVFLDLGNDDFAVNRDLLEEAENEGAFHLLHMAVRPLTDDLDVVGYMGVPLTPFAIKDWERPDKRNEYPPPETRAVSYGYISTTEGGTGLLKHWVDVSKEPSIEEELAELEKGISRPFIFVCHAPPYGTNLDVLYSGLHVGSRSVREFIERWGKRALLKASFHGHIHEAPYVSGSEVDYIAGVECVNAGQDNHELQYALRETDDPGPAEGKTLSQGR